MTAVSSPGLDHVQAALLCVCVCVCGVRAGPGAAQQLVDTSKGYAVLLKKGSVPLTAGLMDVYGKVRAPLTAGTCMAESMAVQSSDGSASFWCGAFCRCLLRLLKLALPSLLLSTSLRSKTPPWAVSPASKGMCGPG